MTDDIKEVMEKAAKLKRLAESEENVGNEEAAKNIAAMLQRLLLKHKLTMSEADFARHLDEEQISKSYVDWAAHGMQRKQKREIWVQVLASFVARAHGCSIMVVEGSNTVVLVGYKSNREIAEYVLVTLVRAANTIATLEYNAFYTKCWKAGDVSRAKGFRASFLMGFIYRVNERLKEELERPSEGPASTSTALMRIGSELVRAEEYVKTNGRGKVRSTLRHPESEDGYHRGREVANKMNLRGNTLEGNGESPQQLR